MQKTEFTLQKLRDETFTPVATIDTTKSPYRYKLGGIYKMIVQKAGAYGVCVDKITHPTSRQFIPLI